MRGAAFGISIWDPIEISHLRCAVWRFPAKSIFVERIDMEWHALSIPARGEEHPASRAFITRAEKPASTAWRHYLIRECFPVQPLPVLPDRPLVLNPDRPLTILPGESALFFLEIPVWFRLASADARRLLVFEEPLAVLSNTWFGDHQAGELCYTLHVRLHQGIESVDAREYFAICPLSLTNDSDTDLPLERLCLHGENLDVYRGQTRLWTNRLNVVFKGPDQATQIQIQEQMPGFEEGLALAAPAREETETWSIRKTFSMLKSFREF